MRSDRRSRHCHPLIYKHPQSGEPVLCFHLGMTEGFEFDDGKVKRPLSREEMSRLLDDIREPFLNPDNVYEHQWENGDFIISDNLALGHEAHPSTQYPVSQVGLRVMHRVTIAGKCKPKK